MAIGKPIYVGTLLDTLCLCSLSRRVLESSILKFVSSHGVGDRRVRDADSDFS